MSEKGLEPSQISPYAPETYVSTISPLRHTDLYSIFNYLRNINSGEWAFAPSPRT